MPQSFPALRVPGALPRSHGIEGRTEGAKDRRCFNPGKAGVGRGRMNVAEKTGVERSGEGYKLFEEFVLSKDQQALTRRGRVRVRDFWSEVGKWREGGWLSGGGDGRK